MNDTALMLSTINLLHAGVLGITAIGPAFGAGGKHGVPIGDGRRPELHVIGLNAQSIPRAIGAGGTVIIMLVACVWAIVIFL